MNNKTVLYYLLSGSSYYQLLKSENRHKLLKREVSKEIEYFFNKRSVRGESWHKIYMRILIAVFSVNLLARRIERRLFKKFCFFGNKYSKFSMCTMLAIKEYNENRAFFNIEIDEDMFINDIVQMVNRRVNDYCRVKGCFVSTSDIIFSNTPMGIEMEFTNKGASAGKFFVSRKNDPLQNFSKYHYYHLMKFMWRFGAYVDAEMPFKQFIYKGGFLEYTFTRPDIAFKTSEPLTSSPGLAAGLIQEAVRFTPIKPHSLHVTFQIDKEHFKLPRLSFDELLFLMTCTGHFVSLDENVYESRITEGNMKEWAVVRDRRNDDGWVVTVEFTHMRVCRDFVRRNVYEPSIVLLLAYKNLFSFANVENYSNRLLQWAKKPYIPEIELQQLTDKIKHGLDKEISLPEYYKDKQLSQIIELYKYNCSLVSGDAFG